MVKECKCCLKSLPVSSFGPSASGKYKVKAICNSCRRERERGTRKKGRTRTLRELYGMSPSDYAEMLHSQGGKCAICAGTPKTELRVDHCHSTGMVRALLCSSCNCGIGLLGDSPDMLEKALAYLRTPAATAFRFRRAR